MTQKRTNILIVGASKGIGRAVVDLAITRADFQVIAAARNVSTMQAIPNLTWMNLDLVHQASIENFAKQVKAQFGYIDYLLFNAGTLVNKPFQQISPQDISQMFQVNVLSAFSLIQLLIPELAKSQQGAHVVTIGSMGGVQGSAKFTGLSAYSSSKAALAVLTECLAEELKPFKISVNCLALGAVQTKMLANAFPDFSTSMTPESMASYILDFLVNGNKYFNGKVLPVATTTP